MERGGGALIHFTVTANCVPISAVRNARISFTYTAFDSLTRRPGEQPLGGRCLTNYVRSALRAVMTQSFLSFCHA